MGKLIKKNNSECDTKRKLHKQNIKKKNVEFEKFNKINQENKKALTTSTNKKIKKEIQKNNPLIFQNSTKNKNVSKFKNSKHINLYIKSEPFTITASKQFKQEKIRKELKKNYESGWLVEDLKGNSLEKMNTRLEDDSVSCNSNDFGYIDKDEKNTREYLSKNDCMGKKITENDFNENMIVEYNADDCLNEDNNEEWNNLTDSDKWSELSDSMEYTTDSKSWSNSINEDNDFMFENYNSEEDDDYVPPEDDDLFFPHGTAKIYDIVDNISFSGDESFFDITDKYLQNNIENSFNSCISDDSCPELIPISEFKEPSVNILKSQCPLNLTESFEVQAENHDNESFLNHALFVLKNKSICMEVNDISKQYKYLNEKNCQEYPDVKFYFSSLCNKVFIHLKTQFYITGAFEIELLAGSAECCGYYLKSNHPVKCFISNHENCLSIKPIQSINSINLLENILLQNNAILNKQDINRISNEFNLNNDCLLLIKSLSDEPKINAVKNLMKENFFTNTVRLNRINSTVISHCKLAEMNLNLKFILYKNIPKVKYLEVNSKWNSIELNENSRTIIVGGQSVGKSTMLRYLINKNLEKFNKILLLDFDIGQPETFLPQTMSVSIIDKPLFGLGVFYSIKPIKSILFGDINVSCSVIKYIKYIECLIIYCTENESLKNIPWIINTMGYTRGLGIEVIVGIIKSLNITEVVQIQSSRSADNFSAIFTKDFVDSYKINISRNEFKETRFNITKSDLMFKTTVVPAYSNMYNQHRVNINKSLRQLRILANIGEMCSIHNCNFHSEPEFLFKISLDNMELFLSNVDAHENPPKDIILEAMKHNLVYLCKISSPKKNIEYLFPECYGIGILINQVDNDLIILSNIKKDYLKYVNSLALTPITIPQKILEHFGRNSSKEIEFLKDIAHNVTIRFVYNQTFRPDTTVENRQNFKNIHI